jgi:O-antigen/teichoic acid export membrane protein
VAKLTRDFLATRLGIHLPANAAAVLALRIAHLAFEFVILLFLARWLSAGDFGVYVVAMSCATVLGVPAAVGFDRLLIREVAALRSTEQWSALGGIRRRATQISLVASALLAAVLLVWAAWFAATPTLREALSMAAVLLPLVASSRLRQATIQGLGRVPLGMIPETLVQPAALLLLAGTAFLTVDGRADGALALQLQVVAAALAMLSGILILHRVWPVRTHAPHTYDTRRWVQSALPLMWMLGMNMVLTSADTIMLGLMHSEDSAGRYRVAVQLAMLVSFPMTAINMAVAPELARLHACGERARLRAAAARASRASLLAGLAVAAVLGLVGSPLLGVFGTGFEAAYPALVVLALGYVVNAFSGSAGYLLIMTGRETTAAWIFTIAALANVGGNYLLIPAIGIMGAATATASTIALVAIGLWLSSRRSEVA